MHFFAVPTAIGNHDGTDADFDSRAIRRKKKFPQCRLVANRIAFVNAVLRAAIAFAQLAGSSDLIDAGTNIGFAFAGAAPDLGAFEYGFINVLPTMGVAKSGTNLVFTGSSGWPNGTNYLIATTNLALPSSQWVRIATNKFDLTGNYIITNAIPTGVPQRFYRVSLL